MEGGEEEIEHCKIRKRGANSSNSSSSSLVQRYRFKRAILLGKRGGGGGGSSTPVRLMSAAAAKSPTAGECRRSLGGGGEDSVFSARKLAATVWEMNKVEHFSGRRKEDSSEDSKEDSSNEKKLLPGLSDPSPLLEDGTDRRRNGQRGRRRSSSAVTKNMLQLADYNPSLMEVESQAKVGKPQMECVTATKTKLKDISNGLLTSKELLKVMNRLWGFDDQGSSGMSLLSALKSEIDRARIQVNHLIKDHQKSNRHEIDTLLKTFEEEKATWRSKERSRIRNAISCIAEELEVERKLRKQTERLNKRLGNELAETKVALRKVREELETEKRAKEILEQVCDELASGVGGEDRDIVEEVKRETAKVREEVEKEREMLLLADVLREERVQMKLSEAKYLFEEKNAAVDRLKNELECYLYGKEDHHGEEYSRPDYDRIKELEAYLKEIEFGALQKSRESLDAEVIEGGDDDSGDDSELHSIELTMENNNNNNKPLKWSFEGIVLDNPKRISVDKDMKGIEWGSISLYKKDSNSDNVVLLDADAINHEIQQMLDNERQLSGGGPGLDEKAKSLRDLLLLSGSRRESSASAQSASGIIIPLQELNNIGGSGNLPDHRVVGVKGERRLSTSSK